MSNRQDFTDFGSRYEGKFLNKFNSRRRLQ